MKRKDKECAPIIKTQGSDIRFRRAESFREALYWANTGFLISLQMVVKFRLN